MQYRIVFQPSGRQGSVPNGTTVLDAARTLGVGIENICGGRQTCAKCRVTVGSGQFPKYALTSEADHVSPVEASESAYRDSRAIRADERLACVAQVCGDVVINVPPEAQAHKQVVRKSASTRIIDVDPVVRQLYVEVDPARMGDRRSDWERLQAALAAQWGLTAETLHLDTRSIPGLGKALRAGHWTATVTVWMDREVIRVRPGYAEGLVGLAVDLGTTTIAAYLCDLRTGEVLATETAMNPQIAFGEDLMSRVSYGMMNPAGPERMHRAVIKTLNDLASQAAKSVGLLAEDIVDFVLVGNPIMHHLFLGIDPVELGGAPFTLTVRDSLDLKARDLGLRLAPGAYVHTLPLQAGHVGADCTAVALAESPQLQDELTLIVDVGTNAEILLGDRRGVLSASSPTGPAFEGAQILHGQRAAPGAIERVRIDPITWEPRFKVIGQTDWSDALPTDSLTLRSSVSPPNPQPLPPVKTGKGGESGSPSLFTGEGFREGVHKVTDSLNATGICGSGIIEAVAELFLAGIIGGDGRFVERDHPRLILLPDSRKRAYLLASADQTATGAAIIVTQDDVRAIQLAKAALYAGVRLLLGHYAAEFGARPIERILLAGAFGSYIDPKYAMILGLIPDCDLDKVIAVGNAAGDGARIALLNRGQRVAAREIVRHIHYIETATDPGFQAAFVDAIHIPHAADAFPHLADILPAAPISERRRRRAVP